MNRKEELLQEEGGEVGGGLTEGSAAVGDGEKLQSSLTVLNSPQEKAITMGSSFCVYKSLSVGGREEYSFKAQISLQTSNCATQWLDAWLNF